VVSQICASPLRITIARIINVDATVEEWRFSAA
jgi:hypothetical protein